MATTRSPRARHRRAAVTKLRDVKANVAWLIDRWTQRGRSTVWVEPAERSIIDRAWSRPREAHEYPEASPAMWREMATVADTIASELRLLAEYARNQATEVAE